MSASERNADLRAETLAQLYAVRPMLVTAERITRQLKNLGYDFTKTEVERELAYHVSDLRVQKQLMEATGQDWYVITAAGVRSYEATR